VFENFIEFLFSQILSLEKENESNIKNPGRNEESRFLIELYKNLHQQTLEGYFDRSAKV